MRVPRNPKINERSDSAKGEGGESKSMSSVFHRGPVETLPGKVAFEFSLDSSVGNRRVKRKDIKMRGKNILKISHMSPQHPSSGE